MLCIDSIFLKEFPHLELGEAAQRKIDDYLFHNKIIMLLIDIFLYLIIQDMQQSQAKALDPIL